MLDWLKRTLGVPLGLHGLANHDGVPDSVIVAIAEDVARLKAPNSSIPEIALKYVVDGVGDAPAAIRGVRNQPGLTWTTGDADHEQRKVRWRIYDKWDELPAEMLVRFGNVLSASSSALSYRTRLLLAQKHPWVEALAVDLLGLPVSHYTFENVKAHPHPHASMARLEALLETRGEVRSELVASTFRSVAAANNHWVPTGKYLRDMPGFGASILAYADSVRPAFRAKGFQQRIYALELLENADATALAPFAEELVALSLDSNRVRRAAVPLALRLGEPALRIARREAKEQKPEQRALALRLLWETGDERERQFVEARGNEDPADSVRKAVQQLRSGAQLGAAGKTSLEIPEVKANLSVPLSKESRDALRAALERVSEIIESRKRQAVAQGQKWANSWRSLSSGDINSVLRQVAEPAPEQLDTCSYTVQADWDSIARALAPWLQREDVRLTHVVRLLVSTSNIRRTTEAFDYVATHMLTAYGRTKPDASLLELAVLLEACGVPPTALMHEWYGRWHHNFSRLWPASAVWPFFAHYREMIETGLNPPSTLASEYWFTRSRVYDALATLPEIPSALVPQLLERALGSNKTDRAGAQRALERLPDKEDAIIEALGASQAQARMAASTWLAQLRHTAAIPHIERALGKEKNDAAAGAHMSALETLGVPVDRFLNRDGLRKDAERALAKSLPTDLAWFPFDGLPQVHWDDNGELVPDVSLRWLIVQSCKLKSPEPGGVLRHYCASFRRTEREAFGLYVLNAWIREDLKPIARADAEQRARHDAQQTIAQVKRYPQYYDDALKNSTEDQLYETFVSNLSRMPAGSATGSKGILAVAAACGGPDIAPPVQRYLKEYYGTRASQGKALIQMLAWVEYPSATQVVLSVGSRFRTKSLQEEATRQAQLLAERKGWTLDELADRTIPTGGFDENCEWVIDYGTRRFTARLTADFSVELYTEENKKIASLPDARKDENEAIVKELKKQLSTAKKELKGVLQLQRDRLYEGLCTQRRWKGEDWMLYLNRHPIVRRYCQQLVWLALREGKPVASFRPLDDGTLTDAADKTFELSPDLQVALAHDTNVAPADAAAWRKHLKDYKVEPLFQQFGKDAYRLPEPQGQAIQLEDFKGVMLDAFTLRNRVTKLGYARGASEDGGWFFRYEKRFPTLELTANIEFSGNGLPEENRRVALISLWFARGQTQAYGTGKLPLGEVPEVLLSECWNDMRMVAAEGALDADWQKQVGM